ncbi:hypothetical protein [Auraticoccus monumenti]|uniref:Uncharacterized protein n=1 Tax=Auraticoccus monumenti TaxID=675864 RepID=A0A1G7CBH9_9ACTN|nr:hypothetical protein [Auraticoccus monumenti]SDE36080.1 hypothetical protein SAMN04489747_3209 [Auraticoccus monumenti]
MTEPYQDALRTGSTTRLLSPLRTTRAIAPESLAQAVHGLVLFVAVVGATFVADYPVGKMLLYSVGSVVLFWSAHVYSAVLAHQHAAKASLPTGLATVWHEARRALPLLEACIAPVIPLLLAVLEILPTPVAYGASVSVGVGTLALVGFLALHNRRASLRRSLVAAATTGGFGAVIIAAETFLH